MTFLKSFDKQIANSLILIISVIILGTFGYSVLEGFSIADGFYMTIITITTVGYGEIQPLSTSGRMFTSVLILVGFASIAYVGRAFAENFFSTLMSSNSEKKKMLKEIFKLKSHYIICGFGRVGNAVAEKLQSYSTKFVVIESNSDSCHHLKEDNIHYIEGSAISDTNLESAGIKNAVGLLAILPSVADNLFITLTARELNPTLHIIARADSTSNEKRLLQAGADIVISPYTSAGHQIAKMMRAACGKVDKDKQSNQILPAIPQWIDIEENSDIIGKTVENISIDKGHKVLGLRRNGSDFLDPDDNMQIELKDKLFLIENENGNGKGKSKSIIPKKASIVIVDDNSVITKLYTRLFHRAGYIPFIAHNGDDALNLIKVNKPDAAVIDLMLPGMSGIEICKNIRKDLNNDDIKLVLFTSDDQKQTKNSAKEAGADAVVIKSPDASELINKVNGLLN